MWPSRLKTADTVNDASRQLQDYKKSVYVAGTDKKAVEKALDKYKDTTIGVMENSRDHSMLIL